MSLLSGAVVLLLLWLFAGSGLHKLRNPDDYQRLVSVYLGGRLTGRRWVISLAVLELSAAVLLMAPATVIGAAMASALILTTYAGAMAWQFWRGEADLHCGCSGVGASLRVGPGVVSRNLTVAGLALLPLVWPVRIPGTLFEGAVLLIIAVTLISLYHFAELLIMHHQAMDEGL